MRIGLLTTSFPRYEGDGAGAFVLGFARALHARGHALEVLAPAPAEEPSAALSEPNLVVRRVRYLWPRSWQRTFYGAGVPDNLRRDPRALLGAVPALAALSRVVVRQRRDWDALVTHWALPCGVLGARLRGPRPHLSVVHSADLHLLERLPLRGALAADLLRRSDHVLFVSAQHRDRFVDLLPAKLRSQGRARSVVQPMGIDLPAQPARPDVLDSPPRNDKRFVLLTLARLVPVKGLLEAMAALRMRDDLSWWIAGEGPLHRQLAALSRRAALKTRLWGHVHGTDKTRLLQTADAFVLPSRVLRSGRTEGVPTALIEAMAHGLPVIASRVGGIPELVRHDETGLLFDPERPNTLLDAIDRLRGDPALRARLAAAGRRHAHTYAWPEVGKRVEQLLTQERDRADGCQTCVSSR